MCPQDGKFTVPEDQMPVEKSQKNIRVGPARLDNYTVVMSFTSSGDNY